MNARRRYARPLVFLLAALMPTVLGAAELIIDHVTVAGKDLKAMQANLAAAGIQTEYGGPHSNHATEMALASFPDGSYLELIAIQPKADPEAVAAHYWSKQLEGDAGPTAWAVRPKNMGAEIARLRAAGVVVHDPARSGRQRPDGTRIEWESAPVGTGPNGIFFPFLIRDFTLRKLRAFPKGHPTTKDFEGVSRVVIAVRDLEASVERYRKAYGLGPPIQQTDSDWNARLALLGGTPVILAAPVNARSWLASRLDRFGEGPCAFVLRAHNASRYSAASKTRWFGVEISWFDAATLGWHLGFE